MLVKKSINTEFFGFFDHSITSIYSSKFITFTLINQLNLTMAPQKESRSDMYQRILSTDIVNLSPNQMATMKEEIAYLLD